jgi:DNA repair protein RecO
LHRSEKKQDKQGWVEPQRDLAIVLKSIPFEDRHRIVVALTENHGQISALARNSIQSRRFGGSLDLFVASDWQFSLKPGASLYHLSDTFVREPFDNIRKDFEKLTLASIFSELVLKASAQQSGQLEGGSDLFRLHSNALSTLNEACLLGLEIPLLNAYVAKLLQWSGNQPRLQSCLECQRLLEDLDPKSQVKCVIANASWVCPQCSAQATRHIRDREGESLAHSMLGLSVLALTDFLMCLRTPIRQVVTKFKASLQDHRELFKLSEALYSYHIPGFDKKPLNGLRFLGLG